MARRARRIERQKKQRTAPVDSVVADADEVTTHYRHCAFDGVEVDELGASSCEHVHWKVAGVGDLQTDGQ